MTKDMIVKAAQEAAARRNEVFALNDLRVDLTARRVWKNGKSVRLTPREYALLEMLIRKRDLALTRGELLTTAWGYEYVGASRTVDVHINRLRTKLGLDKEIQTVFKVGYRLNTHPAAEFSRRARFAPRCPARPRPGWDRRCC